MYQFHTRIHARPASPTPGPPVEVGGRQVRTIAARPADLGSPLPVSFEQAAAALEGLPGMYVEPDGYFIWVSPPGGDRWQVDGHLYDRNGRLVFVELKGSAPPDQLDLLLGAIGWSGCGLMFEMVQQAVFLAEDEFRTSAARAN